MDWRGESIVATAQYITGDRLSFLKRPIDHTTSEPDTVLSAGTDTAYASLLTSTKPLVLA